MGRKEVAMAQVHRSRKAALLSRLGLKGTRVPLVAAGVVVVALFCGVALVGLLGSGGTAGVELRRAVPEAAATTSAGAASEGGEAEAAASAVAATVADTPARIYVHVDGAVEAPGVYELVGTHVRANDAVRAAGGLSLEADTSRINLAAPLSDGDKLYVPAQGEGAAQEGSASAEGGSQGSTSAGDSSEGGSTGVVNINTATASELDALPGVGPSTATSIVEDREANGPFASPEDLMRVSGIGEKKFAKLKDHICV